MGRIDNAFRAKEGLGLTKNDYTNADKRLGGWSLIASNPWSPGSISTATTLAELSRTVKSLHVATEDASEIMLVYANLGAFQGTSMNAGLNPILIGASLQKMGSSVADDTGYLVPVSFRNGKPKIHVDGTSVAFSEPAFFQVAKGEKFYIRTHSSAILPPGPTDAPSLATATTGGTLVASSVYNICITYVFQDGFESLTSPYAAITTGASGSAHTITVTSPAAVVGAIGWRAYMTSRNAPSNGIYTNGPNMVPFGMNCVITEETKVNALLIKRAGGGAHICKGSGVAGGGLFTGLNSGEYMVVGDQTINGFSTTGTVGPAGGQHFPIAIMGRTKVPAKTVALIGDSRMAGTGDHGYDTNGGFGARAMTNQLSIKFDPLGIAPLYGYVKLALGGEKASQWGVQASSNQFVQTRQLISALATNVICNYGTNDLSDALATIQTNLINIARWYTSRGQKFFQCTITPRTTTTNGWTTAAGQSPDGNETRRVQLNDWLRDTGPTGFVSQVNAPGLVDIIDLCKYTEVNSANVLTLNGGRWRVPTGVTEVTGTVTAVTGSYEFTDNTKSFSTNQYKGWNVVITSGAAAGRAGCISWNNATVFNTNNTTVGATVSVGDTYKLTLVSTNDGIHDSSQGHIWCAQAIQEVFSRLI